MAELHIVGEISGGRGFGGHSFFCTYEIVAGTQWAVISGATSGTSHVMANSHEGIVWSFPLDCHFAFQSAQGWPRISLQIWSVDEYGRKDLAGYGVTFVPSPVPDRRPQTVTISTWKPTYWHSSVWMRLYQQMRQSVMGGNPVLRDDSLVHSNDNRYKLVTTTGGDVTLSMTIVTRNAAAVGLRFL
jgi:B9 domain-containing protein 2